MSVAILDAINDRESANAAAHPHIVHATECLAGGTLAFLIRLTHDIDALGIAQTLVYSRRPDTDERLFAEFPPSLKMIEVPPARGLHWQHIVGMIRGLRSAVDSRPTLAVHLHSSKAGFVGRFTFALGRGPLRLFYSPHGLAFLNTKKRLSSTVYRFLERVAGVVRCQPVGCGVGEAKLLEGLTSNVPFVLENPVAERFFEIERREASPPVVLSAGRTCEQKAPEVFAEIAVRFQIDEIAAKFVWVGSGEPDREAHIRAAGGEVTGWLSTAEVARHMSEASVYVQTSRWEGLPLAVIQAMAAGLPCVVTDVVGNRDAVRHGFTGFIAQSPNELAGHIALLLRHRSLRERMGENARREAFARFGPTRFRESVAALYGVVPVRSSHIPELEASLPPTASAVVPTLVEVLSERIAASG